MEIPIFIYRESLTNTEKDWVWMTDCLTKSFWVPKSYRLSKSHWLSMFYWLTKSDRLANNKSDIQNYSRWHRMSHFWDFLFFWPLFGLKHLIWGSHFITSKVTMPKLTFRRKLHWKMPYFWAFYHSKLRRKIIHFFIEWVS